MSPEGESVPGIQAAKAQRISEDRFFIDYANHVLMETSTWDLKLIFGQLDQSTQPATTQLRSAITMPWVTAKLLCFFLLINLRGYEITSGPIHVPPEMVPKEFPKPTQEMLKNEPRLTQVAEELEKLRKNYFGLKD